MQELLPYNEWDEFHKFESSHSFLKEKEKRMIEKKAVWEFGGRVFWFQPHQLVRLPVIPTCSYSPSVRPLENKYQNPQMVNEPISFLDCFWLFQNPSKRKDSPTKNKNLFVFHYIQFQQLDYEIFRLYSIEKYDEI